MSIVWHVQSRFWMVVSEKLKTDHFLLFLVGHHLHYGPVLLLNWCLTSQLTIFQSYMSIPTRKPPLWHFTYSNVICLHSYNVCKDDKITIFWKLNIVACMLYFNVWSIVFLIRNFSTVDRKILRQTKKCAVFHKGGFPVGPLICDGT